MNLEWCGESKAAAKGSSATGVWLAALGEGNEKGVYRNRRLGIREPTYRYPGLAWSLRRSALNVIHKAQTVGLEFKFSTRLPFPSGKKSNALFLCANLRLVRMLVGHESVERGTRLLLWLRLVLRHALQAFKCHLAASIFYSSLVVSAILING